MTPDEKATGTSVKTILQYLLDEDERLANEAPAGTKTSSRPVSIASAKSKLRASTGPVPARKAPGRKKAVSRK
jgi:hypothetical protein